LDVGLEYATLKNYQMMVAVSLRTKAEWEATTTYSLENYLGTPHFEEDGNSDGLADQWTELGTPTTTLDTTIYLIGTQSQKVVTDTAGDDGIYSDNVSATETSGVGYAWVYKASGDEVAVELYDVTATKTGANDNTWKRLVVSSDSLVINNNHSLRIIRRTGDASAATTYYVDQCYLEMGTTTTPTGWKSCSDIKNHEDSGAGHILHVDVVDIPGDRDAATRFYIQNVDTTNNRKIRAIRIGRMIGPEIYNVPWVYYKECQGTVATTRSGGEVESQVSTSSTWTDITYFPLNVGDGVFGAWRLFAVVYDPDEGGATADWRALYGPHNSYEYTSQEAQVKTRAQWSAIDLGTIVHSQDKWDTALSSNEMAIKLQVKRNSGTEYVQIDFYMLIPISTEFLVAKEADSSNYIEETAYLMADGLVESPPVIILATKTSYATAKMPMSAGSLWGLTPGMPNRLIFLATEGTDTAEHYIDTTMWVSIKYRPRGLHFRGSDL